MTTNTGITGGSGFLPQDFSNLIELPVAAASVAYLASTLLVTSKHSVQLPLVTADPAAAWTAEGADIALDDPEVNTLTCVPSKVAGLTKITNELAADSTPGAIDLVGRGLARDIARKVDAAFLGNTVANGPSGLGSLTGANLIESGTPGTALSVTNLDPFAEAMSNAEVAGATVSAFIANPADVLALVQLKDQDGSNRPLLGVDPTNPTRRTIFGVPLLSSPQATAGSIWAVPSEASIVVQRTGTEVVADSSAYFGSDCTGVRAIMRVGFAFPNPAAITQLHVSFA